MRGGLGQRGPFGLEPAVAAFRGGEVLDLGEQRPERLPVVPDDLAEEQVQALDPGGSLVQAVDLRVPDVLLDRVVLEEPGAAERLQGQGEHLIRPLGADALDHRQQQVVQARGGLVGPVPASAAIWRVSWIVAVYRTSARMPSA